MIGSTWDNDDDVSGLEKDCNDLEQILIAKTMDAEALELHTLSEAHCCPEWAQWECAIEEITTLKAVDTWHLEEPPLEANVISSK